MMFSKTTRAALAPVFLIAFTFSGSALACSTDGWDSTSGSIAVGQPFDATPPDLNGISRFEEFCGLRVDGTGYVQTNSPSHSRVRARFYVYANLASTRGVGGAANLLNAYSAENGSGELLHVAYDDGTLIFDATPNGGTQGMVAASAGWNLIEFDWNPAAGNFDVWVNTDATVDLPDLELNSGAVATMESVRLGLPGGLGSHTGAAYFDTFQLQQELAMGPVANCDADGDTMINVNDAVAIVDEIFQAGLAPGTPDCDFSGGAINVNDAVAVINVIFGG